MVAPAGTTPTGTKPKAYQGPYLTPNGGICNTGVPSNPFGDPQNAIATHWVYNPKTGAVKSAVGGTTLDGRPYEGL